MHVALQNEAVASAPLLVHRAGAGERAQRAAMARPVSEELSQNSDAQLYARLRAGDSAAFADLMQRHMGAVFGVAYGVLHNRDDAADVAQDVFLKLYQSLAVMRVQGSLAPWLYRVAMNRAIDRLRQAKRERIDGDYADDATHDDLGSESPGSVSRSPEVAIENIELRRQLFRAMAALPERQRIVFAMRHLSGLSLDEIAAATGCATGTVKCHLARATRRLRELLAPYLGEARGSPESPQTFRDPTQREV